MPAKNFRPLTTNLEHPKAEELQRLVQKSGIRRTVLIRMMVKYGLEHSGEVLFGKGPIRQSKRKS